MFHDFFDFLRVHVPITSPLVFGGVTLVVVGYVIYIGLAKRRRDEGREPEL